jgi:hypothetical protein
MQINMAVWMANILITVKQVDLVVHSFVSLTNAASNLHILCLFNYLFVFYLCIVQA